MKECMETLQGLLVIEGTSGKTKQNRNNYIVMCTYLPLVSFIYVIIETIVEDGGPCLGEIGRLVPTLIY